MDGPFELTPWVWALGALVLAESSARFLRFRLAPLRLRLFYAAYLLNGDAVNAIHEIDQRVHRAGLRSFQELFAFYGNVSGKSAAQMEALFGLNLRLRQLRKMNLVLKHWLRWHIGLMPVPNQRLRTITIGAGGTRETGGRPDPQSGRRVRRVVLLGGSTAFGLGATGDAATIAGQLQRKLNARDAAGSWIVENHAFNGATSFQELLVLLQRVWVAGAADYVVSLSGYNDVDQQFAGVGPGVSAQSQTYSDYLQHTPRFRLWVNGWLKRSYLAAVGQRFVDAYRRYPALVAATASGGRPGAAVERVSDNPNIYPLY